MALPGEERCIIDLAMVSWPDYSPATSVATFLADIFSLRDSQPFERLQLLVRSVFSILSIFQQNLRMISNLLQIILSTLVFAPSSSIKQILMCDPGCRTTWSLLQELAINNIGDIKMSYGNIVVDQVFTLLEHACSTVNQIEDRCIIFNSLIQESFVSHVLREDCANILKARLVTILARTTCKRGCGYLLEPGFSSPDTVTVVEDFLDLITRLLGERLRNSPYFRQVRVCKQIIVRLNL